MTDLNTIGHDILSAITAHDLGYQLGRSVGYDEGFRAGADDAYERVQSVLTACTSTWSTPTQEELRIRRDDPPITSPCKQRCKWCTTCRRYAHWWQTARPDLKEAS